MTSKFTEAENQRILASATSDPRAAEAKSGRATAFPAEPEPSPVVFEDPARGRWRREAAEREREVELVFKNTRGRTDGAGARAMSEVDDLADAVGAMFADERRYMHALIDQLRAEIDELRKQLAEGRRRRAGSAKAWIMMLEAWSGTRKMAAFVDELRESGKERRMRVALDYLQALEKMPSLRVRARADELEFAAVCRLPGPQAIPVPPFLRCAQPGSTGPPLCRSHVLIRAR